MIRFISFLILLAGLGVAAIGGWRMMGNDLPAPAPTETLPAVLTPVPEPAPAPKGGVNDTFRPSSAKTAGPTFTDTMKQVDLAHETPKTAKFGKPFDVTLALNGTDVGTAADALPKMGRVTSGTAIVSGDVKAVLSGAAFDITTDSPLMQQVSPSTQNTWRWRVTPIVAGDQNLTIEVFSMQGDRAMPVKSYQDIVTVEVSTVARALSFAQEANPLFMVLGGIGSALAGLFGAARFFRS